MNDAQAQHSALSTQHSALGGLRVLALSAGVAGPLAALVLGYLVSPYASVSAGLLAAEGVLAALHARERTGEGQFIETSLYAGALVVQSGTLVRGSAFFVGTQVGPLGATPVIRLYPCRDDKW